MDSMSLINIYDGNTSSSESDSSSDKSINLTCQPAPRCPTNISERFKRLTERQDKITAFSNWKIKKIEERKLCILNKRENKVRKLENTNIQKEILVEQEKEWADLKNNYLDVNKHLTGAVDHKEPKSGLEEEIKKAISKGEIEEAEQLSDHLSNRDFGVRIHKAFAAKEFAKTKAIEKDILKKKTAAKPYWGFQTKQRWEMKGNM